MSKIDNIDKFGNCVSCHKQLVKNMVIGGKVQGVVDPNYSHSYFKLNTGSILVAPICKACKVNMDLDNLEIQKNIWKEVNHGWQLEIDHMKDNPDKFRDFDSNKENDLRTLYAGLNIINHEANHKVGVK